MKKLILLAALALGACNTAVPVSTSPAPLSKVVVDDKALKAVWNSFDVALDAIKLLREQGIIQPRSARALAIAAGVDRVTFALQAAEHAAAAGSTTDYLTALAEAKAAFLDIRTAIKGN